MNPSHAAVTGRPRAARPLVLAGLIALAGLLAPIAARAHPHVWVTARSELVFSGDALAAIRHVWQFDEAFTAFAIQGLDSDGDGTLTQAELQPLAKVNVESLSEFDFFTFVAGGDFEAKFAPPTEYWLDFNDGKLTLFYTLELETAVSPVGGKLTVEVYDPTYFVDFAMVEEDPVLAANLPSDCSLAFEKPQQLDSEMAAALAQIPATQKEIPAEFMTVTETLTNKATVSCE